MKYSPEEVIQFVQEEDVKFIRLAFCDVYGKQKNITIMPSQLQRAFTYGVAFGHCRLWRRGPLRSLSPPRSCHPHLPALAAGEWPGGAHVL